MKVKLVHLMMLLFLLVPVTLLAAEEQVTIDIQGMTCSLCPIAIKKSLSGIEGVTGVEVSFKEKKGWLTAEESVSDEQLLAAIKKAGPYKAVIKERKTNTP